jgi:hypothetical protein
LRYPTGCALMLIDDARRGARFAEGCFTVRGGRIVELDIIARPERLRQLDLTVLDSRAP